MRAKVRYAIQLCLAGNKEIWIFKQFSFSTVVFVTAERYTKLIAISTIVHNLEDHAKNMRLSCIDDSTLNIWRGFKNRSHDKKVFLILQVSSYSRMQNNK